jgi:hypothetical protein
VSIAFTVRYRNSFGLDGFRKIVQLLRCSDLNERWPTSALFKDPLSRMTEPFKPPKTTIAYRLVLHSLNLELELRRQSPAVPKCCADCDEVQMDAHRMSFGKRPIEGLHIIAHGSIDLCFAITSG